MSTVYVSPTDDRTIQQALAELGKNGVDSIQLEEGTHDRDTRLDLPAPPPGSIYTMMLDAAVLDLGARQWADLYSPGGGYRNMRVPAGWRILSEAGVVTGTTGFAVLAGGDGVFRGIQFTTPYSNVINESSESPGGIHVLDCEFYDVGLDPAPQDDIWKVVGRVPWDEVNGEPVGSGDELNGGGITFDVHDAVWTAGLQDRIVYAETPDITDAPEFSKERTMLYFLVKHLGYKGAGKHACYFQGPGDYIVSGCSFMYVSGYGVFLNPSPGEDMESVSISNNVADSATALYCTWGNVVPEVVSNRVDVRFRDNGPRWNAGFVLNAPRPPVHRNNVWRYPEPRDVWAFRTWNDSPSPDLTTDRLCTPDGSPMRVWGGLPIGTSRCEEVPPPIDPDPECPCRGEFHALAARIDELERQLTVALANQDEMLTTLTAVEKSVDSIEQTLADGLTLTVKVSA